MIGNEEEQGNSFNLLVGELRTAEAVVKFLPVLLVNLENNDRVYLDLRGQMEIGYHGLQLLCAAHRSALKRNKRFTLVNCAEALRRMVHNAGYLRQESCLSGCYGICLWSKDSPWIG